MGKVRHISEVIPEVIDSIKTSHEFDDYIAIVEREWNDFVSTSRLYHFVVEYDIHLLDNDEVEYQVFGDDGELDSYHDILWAIQAYNEATSPVTPEAGT